MKLIEFLICLSLGLLGVFITGSLIGAAAGLICYAVAYGLKGVI